MATKEQLERALINADKAGDVDAAKTLAKALKEGQYDSPSPQASQPAYTPFAEVKKEVDPTTLNSDPDWIRASRLLYQLHENKPYQGDDATIADWGKDYMGNYNFNMLDMTTQAHDVMTKANQQQKEAFLYMMDTYDNTTFSWEGAGRAAVAIGSDPTTYVGLGTLGIGSGAKIGAQMAAKEALKQTIKKAIGRTGIIAGIEGGLYGGTGNAITQNVEIDAGRKQDFSGTESAISTGIGVFGGAALGTATDAVASKIVNAVKLHQAAKELKVLEGNQSDLLKGVDLSQPVGGSNGASVPPPVPDQGVTPQAVPTPPPEVPPGVSQVDLNASVGYEAVPGQTAPTQAAPNQVVPESTVAADFIGLTPEEVAAATRRQQKGRLPEDNISPAGPLTEDMSKALAVNEPATGLRTTARKMAEVTSRALPVVQDFRDMSLKELQDTIESLRNPEGFSVEAIGSLTKSIQLYHHELRLERDAVNKLLQTTEPNSPSFVERTNRVNALEERMASVAFADDAWGSMIASMLRQRKDTLNPEMLSPETIMKSQNVSKEEADIVYSLMTEQVKNEAAIQAKAREYDQKIQEALDKGDHNAAGRIRALKIRELDALADVHLTSDIRFIHKVNEAAISNIFSPTTIAVNLAPSAVKTVMIPHIKLLLNNPFEAATRAEWVAHNTAMASSMVGALKGAVVGFKYEHAILSREPGRLLEGEMAIKGKFGGAVRFIPRLLNASDEFLSQVNYAGFVAGKAAANAAVEGAKNGLKGAALKKYIKEQSKLALDGAYKVSDAEDLIRPIINKGVNLGYSGDALYEYVTKNASKDLSSLRSGADKDAIALVNDVLYKRRFSGDGRISSLAQRGEGILMEYPSIKFFTGQMFYRTPIRVFEEGIRMTPGVQILAPNFMSDLAGKNGPARQIRAQAESLMSLAFASAVYVMYSQGKLTGDHAYKDWKAERTDGDSANQPQYSYQTDDGSYVSYRAVDPIATPVKIMVNALERFEQFKVREAQGEFIGISEFKQAYNIFNIGYMSVVRAISDANLVEGIDQLSKLIDNLSDPEQDARAIWKYVGDRLSMAVPNTIQKIAKTNDPTIKDPVTFEQVLMTRVAFNFGASNIETARAYDVLGYVRQIPDVEALWNPYNTVDHQDLAKGRTEKDLKVMEEITNIQKMTGKVFSPPLKHPLLGNLDLRTIMAKDGKETLYDKWNRIYNAQKPGERLYPIAVAPLPMGTFKYASMKYALLSEEMNKMRDDAFWIMMADEKQVVDAYITEYISKTKAEAGMNDYTPMFFQK